MITAFPLTAIYSQSPDLLGPWWCLGATPTTGFPLSFLPASRQMVQWTRTPTIGICIAWVCHESDPCRLTPLTGEQHAATQITTSITEITFVETSRISTLLITLEAGSAEKWNTLISVDTLGSTSQHVSGRALVASSILTVLTLVVSLIQHPARCLAKTTSVAIRQVTPISAALKMASRPRSGGLEVICEKHWPHLVHWPNSEKQFSSRSINLIVNGQWRSCWIKRWFLGELSGLFVIWP